jgi:hypothetical protein
MNNREMDRNEVQGSHHLKFIESRGGTRWGLDQRWLGWLVRALSTCQKRAGVCLLHRHFSAARLLGVTEKVQ